ncbi:MAG: DNA cytosine methyltransferase [Clostridiales bacterium]|nr:DNA cytosine methyltransferase [Clostridiales bacterium]
MSKLTYISLFSSAGIGCYGFKMEKFNCVATNELLQRRLDVQRANNKCKYESGYIQGDILLEETKQKILSQVELWKTKEKMDELTVLVATPPCQGMSVANHKKGDESKRNSLVVASLELIKQIQPKFFVLENVKAFLTTICTDLDGKDKKIKDAINTNLGDLYNIEFKVLNFKNYGANSSRTRTLVIGARKDLGITPEILYPVYRKEKTLREIIGDLPSLKVMGEISPKDIFHYFRKYSPEMRNWIELLKEGQSAFDNTDKSRLPHYYRNGEIIYTKNGNSDKYTRQYWDKVAPCVHTRNDILASQATVHPVDDRVFSIREIMRMMSIPETFKWTNHTLEELNALSLEDKEKYLSQNDINIRQSLGEAVPTEIFRQIAKNISKVEK